jgi:hypothetical protein
MLPNGAADRMDFDPLEYLKRRDPSTRPCGKALPFPTGRQRLSGSPRAKPRGDKWYLADGRAALFAPAFPLWVHRISFWDVCHFADLPLNQLFTVFFLDEQFRPLELRAADLGRLGVAGG